MASHSELSLDCKPRSFPMLLKSFGEQTDQTNKLEEFLSRLEGERLKIDAFKRELPLCMHLLTNAMEASRQQLQAFRSNQGARPVLEEFMPIKHSNSEGPEKASDKANWMTTAQLWSQASEAAKPQSIILSSKELDIGFNITSNLVKECKQRNGGAFLPFSKDRNSGAGSPIRTLPELALAPSEQDTEEKKCSEPDLNGVSCPKRENFSKGGTSHSDGQTTTPTTATSNTSSQPHRKARRCWSPDLHRRFVNALQMLGGSQVATPKQIRELMKVDGLTNDEVKSHLQKYRLHTRRPSPSPQATGGPGPQLVVLGGIWVPPEYATAAAAAAAHNGTPTIYSPHPAAHAAVAPPHYCTAATTVPQEFYTAASQQPPLPPPVHHLPLHHQVHMFNKATSQAHSSPESDNKGGADRSESIEDGKSDSSSWKNESGENEGGTKGLAALREEGEESNGSEITLKF